MNARAIFLMSALVILMATVVWAGEEPAKKLHAQTNCPVLGGKINKDAFADYNGWRVYFCCPMCSTTFKEDPEKYVKKLQGEGIQLEQTPQTVCPVSGQPINKDVSVTYEGHTIYFCCNACPAVFEKDPAKFLEKLGIKPPKKTEEQGVAAPQGQVQ